MKLRDAVAGGQIRHFPRRMDVMSQLKTGDPREVRQLISISHTYYTIHLGIEIQHSVHDARVDHDILIHQQRCSFHDR